MDLWMGLIIPRWISKPKDFWYGNYQTISFDDIAKNIEMFEMLINI